jgi:hypothetical protein
LGAAPSRAVVGSHGLHRCRVSGGTTIGAGTLGRLSPATLIAETWTSTGLPPLRPVISNSRSTRCCGRLEFGITFLLFVDLVRVGPWRQPPSSRRSCRPDHFLGVLLNTEPRFLRFQTVDKLLRRGEQLFPPIGDLIGSHIISFQ